MTFCLAVACLWSSLMWRISTAVCFVSRICSSRRLLRQSTSDRHRKWPVRFQLLSFSICCCIFSIFVLLKASHFGTWHLDPTPVTKNHDANATAYLYGTANRIMKRGSVKTPLADCDFYAGSWVHDGQPSIYNSSTCPFAEAGFSCQENGRPDSDYLKWRWQPFACDIPWFNAKDIRRRLNGQRVAFVGDSMGRTQWESFICLLMADIPDKKSIYEVNGNSITKLRPYLAVKFSTFNFTIEYYRAPYLVQEGPPPKHVPKRVQSTLKLDRLEKSESRWLHADVLVFNTGHWWTSSKTFGRGCYFQVDKSIKLGMNLETAYRIALHTWAIWVRSNINLTKTQVFFRSYEPAHWEGSWRNLLCPLDTKPVLNSTYSEDFPHLSVLQDVIHSVKAPVTVLNITSMSSYRRDSHVANWTRETLVDCGHWCLPGLPDTWNGLLYASLLQKGEGVWAQQ